jgi:cell pole-organizing protein PopZ
MSDKPLIMGDINQEPSMEDILASIKRVIAEDGRPAARPARGSRPAEAPKPEPAAEDDVLELQDPVSEGQGLVSDDAAIASRQSLAVLASLRATGAEAAPADEDAALGAAVREMLKPLLKDWLDRNLPDMVEELVTREIARITGKSL